MFYNEAYSRFVYRIEFNPLSIPLLQSPLDWWPKIDAVYCYSGELRIMVSETLGHVMRGCSTHAPLRMTPVRHTHNKNILNKPKILPVCECA